jgi:hypothetical protein
MQTRRPRISLLLTDEEYQLINDASKSDQRSMNTWCRMALLSSAKGTKPITTTLLPGQDLIVQNRSSNGKFAKRSK